MYKTVEKELVASCSGINYYVIFESGSLSGRAYGIMAESIDDTTDFQSAENLFFTIEEARHYCKWFSENEVYPVTLREVLANIYHIEV